MNQGRSAIIRSAKDTVEQKVHKLKRYHYIQYRPSRTGIRRLMIIGCFLRTRAPSRRGCSIYANNPELPKINASSNSRWANSTLLFSRLDNLRAFVIRGELLRKPHSLQSTTPDHCWRTERDLTLHFSNVLSRSYIATTNCFSPFSSSSNPIGMHPCRVQYSLRLWLQISISPLIETCP